MEDEAALKAYLKKRQKRTVPTIDLRSFAITKLGKVKRKVSKYEQRRTNRWKKK